MGTPWFNSIWPWHPSLLWGCIRGERTYLKPFLVTGNASQGDAQRAVCSQNLIWHFLNPLDGKAAGWPLANRPSRPQHQPVCVQSNPHQGHLLQFLSMELLGKHKLWINFRLSEGGKRRLMGQRHVGLGQHTERGLCVRVLNYCPVNHQNHLGFLLYHNTLFHPHH